MSLPSDSSRPQAADSRASKESINRQVRGARLFVWLFILALVGPCAATQVPREIGRWHLAAALNLRSQDHKGTAGEELASAIAWFPKSPILLLQRAEWQMEDGHREEALADCDRMLEAGGEQPQWLRAHAQFLQNAGQFAGAVDDWKKIDEFSERSGIPSRQDALNGLAYSQALANVDLDDALAHANQALDLQAENNEAILDTRGYIYYLKDEYALAIADLDQAVKGMDAFFGRLQANVFKDSASREAGLVRDPGLSAALPKTLLEVEPRRGTTAFQVANLRRSVAVLHYHRALILSALGRNDEAVVERERVKQLIGKEPDETLF